MNTNHDKCMLLRYRISQDICDWKSLEHHEEKIDSYIGNGEEHPFLNISRTKNEEINLKIAKTWFGRQKLTDGDYRCTALFFVNFKIRFFHFFNVTFRK